MKGTGLARIHANFKRGVLSGIQAAVRELEIEICIFGTFCADSQKKNFGFYGQTLEFVNFSESGILMIGKKCGFRKENILRF